MKVNPFFVSALTLVASLLTLLPRPSAAFDEEFYTRTISKHAERGMNMDQLFFPELTKDEGPSTVSSCVCAYWRVRACVRVCLCVCVRMYVVRICGEHSPQVI